MPAFEFAGKPLGIMIVFCAREFFGVPGRNRRQLREFRSEKKRLDVAVERSPFENWFRKIGKFFWLETRQVSSVDTRALRYGSSR